MKQAAARLSLITAFSLAMAGTTCGALPLKAKGHQPSAPVAIDTPELQAAASRVKACEDQLTVAKKQLSAAKSLLKAAEADLKAAKADRDALALRTQANGLAQEAGMPAPKSLAQAPVARTAVAPATLPSTTPLSSQPTDFSTASAPTPDGGEAVPAVQLR